MKKCYRCENYKELLQFHKDCTKKDGYYHNCKQCVKEDPKKSAYKKEASIKNRSSDLERLKKWKNKQKSSKLKKIKHRQYMNNRYKNDINFKLADRLRSRMRYYLHYKKTGSHVKDLGCTIDQLKQHLESKFQPGMTWDNYGFYGWHIDHIRPLASFDLTDREQFLQAVHYTNLQPLWAKDNWKKHSNISNLD